MTQTTIYLVSELWIDTLENDFNMALGYKIIGFVDSIDEFNTRFGAKYVEGTGWPIAKSSKQPAYKYEEVKHV